MDRRLLIFALLFTLTVDAHGQKSRVLSVIQLIESENYSEAKEAIELAVWNDKTSRWSRTYYAKGLLCQKAYEAGLEKNDAKLTSLYPDQLMVAYNSYQRALELNARGRVTSSIAKLYYPLANDFQMLGTRYFRSKEYTRALEAFEHALLVSSSPLVSVIIDTSLIYNTALAAYESQNWERAISYLTRLNDDGYSAESALRLYRAHIYNGDSIQAEEVLFGAVERYRSEEILVLQLVDLLVATNRLEKAIEVLDSAQAVHSGNPYFPWTKGLIYERLGMFENAIASLKQAGELDPGDPGIHYSLGICHYNMGVQINERALAISDNRRYKELREEARDQFTKAVIYLEKARELDPGHAAVNSKLSLLYKHLQLDQQP
jgi:tetratricopeptide (TPR) repeat protein